MNRIVLEDDENRILWFREHVVDSYIFENAESCINYLRTQDHIDVLFLDHDLGGQVWVDERNRNTGSEVVRYLLAEHNDVAQSISQIIIHSINYPAAQHMLYDLRKMYDQVLYLPFPLLMQSWKGDF